MTALIEKVASSGEMDLKPEEAEYIRFSLLETARTYLFDITVA